MRRCVPARATDVRVTIGDVALHAGVSKTTVSRVLNDRGEVEAETARRVRDVIDRLGYVPSARAVGLALGRTSTVGMLVPSLGWPWMSQIVQGVADILEARKYGLLLYTCTRGKESLEEFAAPRRIGWVWPCPCVGFGVSAS